jgi:hypothetical protein
MKQQQQKSFLRRHVFALTIMFILTSSMLVPGILQMVPTAPPMVQPDPIPDPTVWTPPITSTVAGEPNFTRESYQFILDNVPNFSWMNPGQFDSGNEFATSSGILGYDSGEQAPGIGTQAYPEIFAAWTG